MAFSIISLDFIIGVLNSLMVLGSLFLICVILIQRGKGGGLAGAFGGVGGSSAFGTKAGDVFTRITIGVAVGWILAAMLLVVLTNRRHHSAFDDDAPAASQTKELGPSSTKSKSIKSKAADLGAGDVPPPIPTPSTAPMLPAPAVDVPAIPDLPPIAPTPSAPSKPASTPAPSSSAPSQPASTPLPK
jgi:preprotein translocase subunit SecG